MGDGPAQTHSHGWKYSALCESDAWAQAQDDDDDDDALDMNSESYLMWLYSGGLLVRDQEETSRVSGIKNMPNIHFDFYCICCSNN